MKLSEIRKSVEYYEKKAKVPDQLPVDIADYKYLLELLDEGAEIVDKFKWKVGKRGKSFCVSCGKNSFYGHQNDCKLNEWLEAVRDE